MSPAKKKSAANKTAAKKKPARKSAANKAPSRKSSNRPKIKLDDHVPPGPVDQAWTEYQKKAKLVNPANKRKYTVIVVGTGLAGGSAAASLGELGYNVKSFCIQDSPRRAHSVAAQGGINSAKNYPNDGDSVYRLFYDTVKGGDFRSREANVHRLAEVSVNIIDQCVAQGVPFAREYGGLLANRSFGGAQLQRTFYARGQTGQQLLLGAYSALMRQADSGSVEIFARREMLDLVVVDGRARGITVRNLVTGEIESHAADAVLLCTGGYSTVYYLSTNAVNSNPTAAWRCYKRGAAFANPCYTQIHPTCIPRMGDTQSKLTLMSESLRNDGRVWVPKKKGDQRKPKDIPEDERDYYLERKYPAFGNLVPRDIASRSAKEVCDAGYGVGPTGVAVYLDFKDAINRLGEDTIRARYGNLFDMYEEITADNPYKTPMMIYPAPHYTMGGLWVDYNLMTTIPGLFALGESNFSDHGANRLGASALMQGLADGYFVISSTLSNYLADIQPDGLTTEHKAFTSSVDEINAQVEKFMSMKGEKTADEIHRQLGTIMWDEVGMARSKAGLDKALREIPKLRKEFHSNIRIPGNAKDLNKELEKAGRVADCLELGELMAMDALHRNESCGGHFREESQTKEGEALRDDNKHCTVQAWEFKGETTKPSLHIEKLDFKTVQLSQRSYK